MILRILGEGQFELSDRHVDALNHLDTNIEQAVEQGDHEAFADALEKLLAAVRVAGSPLPPEQIVDSELILPPADATLEEVRELLGDDGLIPG